MKRPEVLVLAQPPGIAPQLGPSIVELHQTGASTVLVSRAYKTSTAGTDRSDVLRHVYAAWFNSTGPREVAR